MPLLLHAESLPDDTVIIAVSGVVAYESPDQILGAVRAAIVRWAPRVVLLDLADVNALDAASIAALLASHQTGEWAGIRVSLINVGPFLLGQLRETGLAGLLCPELAAEDDDAMPGDPIEPPPSADTPAPDTVFGAAERRTEAPDVHDDVFRQAEPWLPLHTLRAMAAAGGGRSSGPSLAGGR